VGTVNLVSYILRSNFKIKTSMMLISDADTDLSDADRSKTNKCMT